MYTSKIGVQIAATMVGFALVEIWLSEAYVKKLFFVLMTTFLFAGCASTDLIDALETRVTALERQVGGASDSAAEASTAAARASRDAAAAQATAQRALDAANAANERAERMAETCCSRK
jgi:outer membrane murein-binding lipoprotein Lpp